MMNHPFPLLIGAAVLAGTYVIGLITGAMWKETITLSACWGGMAFFLVCQYAAHVVHNMDHKRFMRDIEEADRRLDAERKKFVAEVEWASSKKDRVVS